MSKRWKIQVHYGYRGPNSPRPELLWPSPRWHVTATHRVGVSGTATGHHLGAAVWRAKLNAYITIRKDRHTARQMQSAHRRGWLR